MIKQIHHVSILTANLEEAVAFYGGILGMTPSTARPNLGFDGAWFELGHQQLHLICPETAEVPGARASRCGRDRHIAFAVDDIDQLIHKLELAGIEFERSRSGRAAIFCRDPAGNALEFIGSE